MEYRKALFWIHYLTNQGYRSLSFITMQMTPNSIYVAVDPDDLSPHSIYV